MNRLFIPLFIFFFLRGALPLAADLTGDLQQAEDRYKQASNVATDAANNLSLMEKELARVEADFKVGKADAGAVEKIKAEFKSLQDESRKAQSALSEAKENFSMVQSNLKTKEAPNPLNPIEVAQKLTPAGLPNPLDPLGLFSGLLNKKKEGAASINTAVGVSTLLKRLVGKFLHPDTEKGLKTSTLELSDPLDEPQVAVSRVPAVRIETRQSQFKIFPQPAPFLKLLKGQDRQ